MSFYEIEMGVKIEKNLNLFKNVFGWNFMAGDQ
jgi:hypothetical protein